ncbi:MAG: HAMP domain-containing histidine kinase [Saprospiraceae bacterium]|nr:HAMP domain-containing histidine kinase [Saprospiraceae bacterium]
MTTIRNILKLSRHQTALLLMATSMAMLFVFQGLWLRKVYDERKGLLQKDAENIFQQTIRKTQDSLISTTILAPLDITGRSVDTAVILTLQNVLQLNMSREDHHFNLEVPEKKLMMKVDSLPQRKMRITINSDTLQRTAFMEHNTAYFFSTSRDSLLPGSVLENTWVCDTIPIAALQMHFQQALSASGILLDAEVLCASLPSESQKQNTAENRILTKPLPAGLPPRTFYYGAIDNYENYLFRKVFPQGMFSLFLLLTTGLAFGFIYQSLRQQQRLAILKNDFISNVAHELKTPIATVGVAIESLRNFDALREPERTAEYLDISKQELNRLSMLVDKVLKMAIFEQKEPDLHMEHFDFRQLVQEVLSSMKLQFEKFGATTTFTYENDHFDLLGDRIHLTNVVYNLLDNALKYSENTPYIHLDLKADASALCFTVSDRGIGIPPEYTGKVFEKFFRVPTGNQHNVKGYGLGLSYVASVLLKHGGRVRLESTPGQGSSFIINIPRKHAKD